MRVAVFGKSIHQGFFPYLEKVLCGLKERGVFLLCEEGYAEMLKESGFVDVFDDFFTIGNLRDKSIDLLLSIGGDGTFLHSLHYVKDSGVPVLGMNTGRLGFLANFSVSEIEAVLDYISSGNYHIEERDVLRVEAQGGGVAGAYYVLNEVSVQKTERSSLLRIHAYIGDVYLTTYWADGLIVASPTGSTAYSLSSGGPILTPDCRNMVLTPLCAHNLSMRSLVIPLDSEVRLKVESRSGDFLMTMDSEVKVMKDDGVLFVSSGEVKMNVVKLPDNSFYRTLREKLGWGEDWRNREEMR